MLRNDIIVEVLRRIRLGFPGVRIFQGEAGIYGKWSTSLPCFHLFEKLEERTLIKPGRYDIQLPLQFEYISVGPGRKQTFMK